MQTVPGKARTRLMLLMVLLTSVAGCECGKTGGQTACPTGQQGSVQATLNRAGVGSDGALLYTGSTVSLGISSCDNRADSFEFFGQSPFAVNFRELQDPNCSQSSVSLGPSLDANAKQNADSTDMMKVFGEQHPPLPLTFAACVAAGAEPPPAIGLSVSYTTK